MSTRRFELRIVLIAIVVAFPLRVAAQPYDISWFAIDGGGLTVITGGSIELGGSIGQCDAGPVNGPMAGGSFSLVGGFWPVNQVCYCAGDLNGDGEKNGDDIQRFANCILMNGDCRCADVDLVGGITVNDVAQFAADLLAGELCP